MSEPTAADWIKVRRQLEQDADARTSLPTALDALDAVLALHTSAPRFSVDFRDCEVHGAACENNVQVCMHCIDCEGEAEVYPCPTVRAITEVGVLE